MSENENLKNFKEIKLEADKKFKEIIGEPKIFPKYTTQLINMANQNAQGTRPKMKRKVEI